MALDMLTATQWGTFVIIQTECSMYISDNFHNFTQALAALTRETSHIAALGADPPHHLVVLPRLVGPLPGNETVWLMYIVASVRMQPLLYL